MVYIPTTLLRGHTKLSKTLGATLAACVVFSLPASLSAQTEASQDQAAQSYSLLLQQIEDMKLNIAYAVSQVELQNAEVASLQSQIESVGGTTEGISPMLDKIYAALNTEIEADLPFNVSERFERLAGLQEIIADPEARAIDQMRRALNALSAEVSYGQSVQAYSGNHPDDTKAGSRLEACEADYTSTKCALSEQQLERINNGATIASMSAELSDGNYLRFGRLSLTYVTEDTSDVLRYDPEGGWVEVSGSEALEIRRAMRVARGESAPDVVKAPILVRDN